MDANAVCAASMRPGSRSVTSCTSHSLPPQRSLAFVAAGLFVLGATLTFFGEGVILAAGVTALSAFVVVGVAELLRPEALE